MRKITVVFAVLIVLLSGCGASESSSSKSNASTLSANDYAEKLKSDGLPIGTIISYTAENDPNELLGRPNQYASKVNFADTTLNQPDSESPTGGSVEVFADKEDAKNRKEYIDNIGKEIPLFAEYSYINGAALLRLDKKLTPEQAKQYEEKFMAIE